MVFIHGTAKQLETAHVPGRKILCRISCGEGSYVVCDGDQTLFTQLREGCLGTKSGQLRRDACLCDEGKALAAAMLGRYLLSRCQCGSLWPGRLGCISAKTDVDGGMREPFPSNMTVAQVEPKWRRGELGVELFHIWLREPQMN